MGNSFFNEYPYTDYHELNLSWVIKELRTFATTLEQFVSINALKYADPIQWNITTQYEKNTIVIDPQTGTAYISVAPVPAGVALTNEDYWTIVFDLGSFVVRASKNFATVYEADTTTSATVNIPAGTWLVWGDTLYKANVNITAGDTYVPGANITHFTMEEVIGHLEDLQTTAKTSLVDAINELQGLTSVIGDLDDLDTTDKTSIVNAINEVLQTITTIVGDLNDLNTTDKTSVVNAINEVLQTITTIVGDLNDLDTTDKTSIVNAINEVVANLNTLRATFTSTYSLSSSDFITEFDSSISTLSQGTYMYTINAQNHVYNGILTVADATHKSLFVTSYSNSETKGIVGLWNYNPQSAQWVFNLYPTIDDIPTNDLLSQYYKNQKVLILGDSLSSPGKVWVNKFTEFVESLGGTVTNWAVNAYTSADMYNKLNTETAQNFDKFIMWIGQNDYNQHVMPGNTGAAFESGTFGYSVENSLLLLISKFGNPEGAVVGIHWSIRQGYTGKKLGRREWSRISYFCAKKYGHTFIDMNKAPFIGWGQDPDVWTVPGDNVHFNDYYQEHFLWQFLAKASAEKNDGLVGIDTEYNINNAPNMFTPATGVSDYRHFLDVEDTGYAHLYMILNTTAQLTPSSGVILLGTWNFDIFSNYETSITAIDSTNKKVYDGILIHGNNGQLRLYTSDTIPSGATLQLRAPHLKTNQLTFYTPTEL